MTKTESKLKSKYLFILLVLLCYSTLHAQETLQKQYVVQLKNECILSIESRFDTSAIKVQDIEKELSKTFAIMDSLIPLDSLTIKVIWPDSSALWQVIPSMGVGGKYANKYEIELYIDPLSAKFKFEHLSSALAHETHHAIRARKTGGFSTLLEAFIAEGLAVLFQMEALGDEQPFFTTALDSLQLAKYIKKSEPLLSESIDFTKDNNLYFQWFLGAGKDNQIPLYTGFSIGWQIVQDYIKAHPNATASSLIGISAEEIAKMTYSAEILNNDNE